MHDVLDGKMLASVRPRSPVDLGRRHVVVSPSTIRKQCFTGKKGVLQLDNERVSFVVGHVLFGEGNVKKIDWTFALGKWDREQGCHL